jgi:hypothetical protein
LGSHGRRKKEKGKQHCRILQVFYVEKVLIRIQKCMVMVRRSQMILQNEMNVCEK